MANSKKAKAKKKKAITPKRTKASEKINDKDPRGRKPLSPEPKIDAIEKGELKPFGWDKEIEFNPELLSRTYFTMSGLSVFTRAVLGHFAKNHSEKKSTMKAIFEAAIEEYYDNHKDELIKEKPKK